jgi:hypothetical protein
MTRFVECSPQGVLVLVGVAGICWSISVLPCFRNEKGLAWLAAQIVEGGIFIPFGRVRSEEIYDRVERN